MTVESPYPLHDLNQQSNVSTQNFCVVLACPLAPSNLHPRKSRTNHIPQKPSHQVLGVVGQRATCVSDESLR